MPDIFWDMGLWLTVDSGGSSGFPNRIESLSLSLALALSYVSLSRTQWLITAEILLV